MFRNWTFGRKVGAGFAVMAIALAIIAVTGYRSTRTLITNDEWVAHTHQVRRQVAGLLAQIVEAESGQRGFVLTGSEHFLEPYKVALGAIDKTYADLHQLTIDNPAQTRRLDALRPAIDEKLALLKRTLEVRRAESLEVAAAAITASQGQVLMDTIRRLVDEIDQDELRLLDIRRRDSESASEATKVIILWGSIGAIVITILAGWLITSSLSGQIGSAVRHIQSSSTELQASANQQATGAREQATAMTEIATTINELLATSRQIADSAKRVSQIAGQTATAARSGETTVTRGHDATATVRKQVDLIVGHMLDLGKKSQEVGSVLDIVSELAEQTNILAINATIEAAGAGDAGRRFGVVAEEIRKLADRVGASTKEIRGLIEDVRSAVNTTVMATEAGSKAVDVATATVVDVATSFRQIASLVGTTTDAAREIELSTKQQATAVEQVNLAISGAAGATRETEASARETLQTASQLADLSSTVLTIVQAKAS
jgi:methyl-accepting chemotaxis protein